MCVLVCVPSTRLGHDDERYALFTCRFFFPAHLFHETPCSWRQQTLTGDRKMGRRKPPGLHVPAQYSGKSSSLFSHVPLVHLVIPLFNYKQTIKNQYFYFPLFIFLTVGSLWKTINIPIFALVERLKTIYNRIQPEQRE